MKVLQKAADKENIVGRENNLISVKDRLHREQTEITEVKRKKYVSKSIQTEPEESKTETSPQTSNEITAKDLTSTENPSEAYWERLAEKRREALEDSLIENKCLHEKIELLVDELNTSNKRLEESRSLIGILQDLLEEGHNEEEEEGDNEAGSDEDNIEL